MTEYILTEKPIGDLIEVECDGLYVHVDAKATKALPMQEAKRLLKDAVDDKRKGNRIIGLGFWVGRKKSA